MLMSSSSMSKPLSCAENGRKKRRPAGTPDPDAEVVVLSPRTLLESDRYVCEICNQAFQRDQNLQMHRRRHKVPWKLLKRDSTPSAVAKKRVFVCPEPSCIHHDPSHALGDLVGIKKHFRRKHSNHKQWVCSKCAKGYAVQSDYKAHIKTCGTRGHSCDCGRVFSRVESFIEHQDACSMGPLRSDSRPLPASSPSPSSLPKPLMDNCHDPNYNYLLRSNISPNLELQLLNKTTTTTTDRVGFSIASSSGTGDRSCEAADMMSQRNPMINIHGAAICEEHKRIIAEKSYAEEARRQAEAEFANARRIRQQAQAELEKAQALKHHAAMQMHSTIMQITCHSCRHKFQRAFGETWNSSSLGENALGLSYISAALREWGVISKCDHRN